MSAQLQIHLSVPKHEPPCVLFHSEVELFASERRGGRLQSLSSGNDGVGCDSKFLHDDITGR